MIDLFCYAILNGQVLDLSYLCQAAPAPIVAPALSLTVDVEEFVLINKQFSGRLRNLSDESILFFKLHFEAYGPNGKFLESGSFHADLQSIPPGGASGFQWFTNEWADSVRIVNVSWQ